MAKAWLRIAIVVVASLAAGGTAHAQRSGGSFGGGAGAGGAAPAPVVEEPDAGAAPVADTGGVDIGDLYGDLALIRRDPVSGQPILEKRRVLLPEDVYGWAYCAVRLDAAGSELPFLPDSCDVDPAYEARIVPVTFGRLSGVRTKERNLRMHLDEVIGKIQEAEAVKREEAGRLSLGTGCAAAEDGTRACATWTAVDAPLENLALYHRVVKYGHLQTDPAELDTWESGDPAALPATHPALRAEDWAKFDASLAPLLPRGAASADACFADVAACVAPQVLEVRDFPLAASFLGAGAGKHDEITLEVVQYMNRILRATCGDTDATRAWCPEPTETAVNPANSLPALVRDCYGGDQLLDAECVIHPADQPAPGGSAVPADSGFPANERLVNFGPILRPGGELAAARYARQEWFGATVSVLKPVPGTAGASWVVAGVPLPEFLQLENPGGEGGVDVAAFVNATRDAVRAVEFVHEYAIPADLGFFPY